MENDPYALPWKNTPFRGAPHEQYCRPDELESCNPKLYKLFMQYGGAFDTYWIYYWNKQKTYCKRRPLWQGNKRIDAEKPKDPFQKKLEAFNIKDNI